MSVCRFIYHPRSVRRTVLALLMALCFSFTAGPPGRVLADQPATRAEVKSSGAGKVFGADERQMVEDTTVAPWSSMGLIDAWFDDDAGDFLWYSGTGTLIGNRTVVTSAHVIYDPDFGWADRIIFWPGMNGTEVPFGSVAAETIIVPESYAGVSDAEHDIALLILETPIGLQAGYMGVTVQPEAFFPDRQLHLAGYPSDAPVSGTLWQASGPGRDLQDLVIRHEIDSESGQSGGPVWYDDEESGSRYLVGVHRGSQDQLEDGVVVDSFNVAVHINASVYNWIRENMLEHDTVVLAEIVEGTGPGGLLCSAAAVVMAGLWGLALVRTRRRTGP